MVRVNRILADAEYIKLIKEIEELEVDRIYCRHDMTHFLDVARIARLICVDENIKCEASSIYAAALLHDIGRGVQYKNGTPHEEASYRLAPPILERAGYLADESKEILIAIKEHGNEAIKEVRGLEGVIYRADKLSRKCYHCTSTDTCHKALYKRNMEIRY